MTKAGFDPMDPFSPSQQPDEGYSEDPLNPSVSSRLSPTSIATARPGDLKAWLINNVARLPLQMRTDITLTLLDQLPTSVIAEIVQRLNPRLYIDFVQYLPIEICLKILGFLDPVSLVSVTQTCRAWYDLALDRKLWEHLYHLEGWKAVPSEIAACEAKVNRGLDHSIRHLHRMQSLHEAHPSKIRAILNGDEDLEMSDGDRTPSFGESGAAQSIFGSPNSFSSAQGHTIIPFGEMDVDIFGTRGKGVDRGSSSSDSRHKRKEPGSDSDLGTMTPIPPFETSETMSPSPLWEWDVHAAQYRINWRYLYRMRRRLESNWELAKFTTFQFPHPSYPEEGHQECVYTIQFDQNYLVSGSRDKTMRIWDVHTRRLLQPALCGHNGSVLCLQFDADPEEDLLVSGSSDSNVIVWKFSTGELIQRLNTAHRESVLNVRFDKRILVTSSKDKTIKIFNRRPLRYGDVGYGGHELVNPVGVQLHRYGYEPDLAHELPVKPPFSLIGRLDGHTAAVNAIQVLDRTVVSVSGDRHIKVWNWPEQICTQTIPAHEKGIACVEFDGRRIVSGSSDYEVCIFDAPTGLKVAQLRGHAHLVRTVQAGFGDLPYSKAQDEADAKAVDAEYFRAVEAGEIDPEDGRRRRLGRRANAGSSRPEDLQAFGAKVPPGGGGGRQYGRIVSGSYDQSIIIWRRDKEGVWKPAQHLRQEEGASAAQRDVAASRVLSSFQGLALPPHVAARLPNGPSSPFSDINSGSAAAPASLREQNGDNYRTATSYMALIDQVVPMGVTALQQAILIYPVILAHHNYLQSVIEQEPSPFTRSQLKRAVSDAFVALQLNSASRQRGAADGPLTNSNLNSIPGPSSSTAAVAGSSSSGGAVSTVPATPAAPVMPATQAPSAAVPAATMPPPNLPPAGQPSVAQPPVVANQSRNQNRNNQNQSQQAQGAPPPPQAAAGQQGGPQPPHHPHMGAPENAPARVFKLQFDARKIICCSQSQVMVGWDFCNKEPDLEEAARFFAKVD